MAEAMCKFSPYGLQMTKQVLWANLETASLAAAIELEDRNQLMLGHDRQPARGDPLLRPGARAGLHRRAAPRPLRKARA